jgi:hypothetical protein
MWRASAMIWRPGAVTPRPSECAHYQPGRSQLRRKTSTYQSDPSIARPRATRKCGGVGDWGSDGDFSGGDFKIAGAASNEGTSTGCVRRDAAAEEGSNRRPSDSGSKLLAGSGGHSPALSTWWGCLVAGMIGGLVSVGEGWIDGRRGAVVHGVSVPGGDH